MGNTRKRFYSPEENISQTFSKDPKIKRNGKMISINDEIQKNREDTEIYPLIDKYGCIEKIPMDTQVIQGDISSIKDLRSLKDQQIAVENLWNTLPLDVRKQFGNDLNNFYNNGEAWINNVIAKENETKKANTPAEPIKTEE